MKQIIGKKIDNLFSGNLNAVKIYSGNTYDTWEMEDIVFKTISEMSEEEFIVFCPEGWWKLV